MKIGIELYIGAKLHAIWRIQNIRIEKKAIKRAFGPK